MRSVDAPQEDHMCAHAAGNTDATTRILSHQNPRKKSNRKYRMSSYGLNQEQFDAC